MLNSFLLKISKNLYVKMTINIPKGIPMGIEYVMSANVIT
jgi:hypothetical protein